MQARARTKENRKGKKKEKKRKHRGPRVLLHSCTVAG